METRKIKLTLALVATLVAARLASAAYAMSLRSQNAEFGRQVTDQTQKIAKAKTQLDELTKSNSELQARISSDQARCESSAQTLKASVDAFAKQAAVCEVVRQRLGAGGQP